MEKSDSGEEEGEFEPEEVDKEDSLRSDKTWEEIKVPGPLISRLIQLGYKAPSKIQSVVIPRSFQASVMAQSQNGSGKTLAFLIPAICFSNPSVPTTTGTGAICPMVIIMADTRALITQIYKLLLKLSSVSPGLKVGYSFSGMEDKQCEEGHIFISTVGRIKNLQKSQKFDTSRLQLVIMDEADLVLKSDSETKFIDQLFLKLLPRNVRILITSATMTPLCEAFVSKLDNRFVKPEEQAFKFSRIEVKKEQLTLKNVKQYYLSCSEENKLEVLNALVNKVVANNILIFCNAKNTLHEIMYFFAQNKHKVCTVVSNEMDNRAQEANINQDNIERFMKGEYRILLTTNLLSRGIDMRKVTVVINYNLPKLFNKVESMTEGKAKPTGSDPETYLHRVGRTGRFGDQGIALNLISNGEDMSLMGEIINYYSIKMTEIKTESVEDLNEVLEEINNFNHEKRMKFEENI
jgi:ATP-dependent RNA helicase DDX19/DBP5